MSPAISHLSGATASTLKRRLLGIYAVLAMLNIGAWVWALAEFRGNATLLGMALVIYGIGLRHAVDADHIAAIDNFTRKLMHDGDRPVSVGFFFALGHSAVVVIVTVLVTAAIGILEGFHSLQEVGGTISTSVSALFLLGIAAMNIVIFVSLHRSYRRVRAGVVHSDEDLDPLLNSRGFLARIFRPMFRLVSSSWHMFPLGFLFGLGFDTATEIAMFGVSASQAADGLPLVSVLVFPVLFAAGMSLVDTTDGVVMLGAYHWAFVNPTRKLAYNMTITAVSVVAAVAIGGVEVCGLIGNKLALTGGIWWGIGAINDNFNSIGCAIIALFLVAWGLSYIVHKLKYPRSIRTTG
jgi:high-affinity nickel-transport protein